MLGMRNYLTDCFYLWDVLVNVGEKVLCLQSGLKVDVARDILTVINYDVK